MIQLNLPDPRLRQQATVVHEAWAPSSPINHPGWYSDDPFEWAMTQAAGYLGPGAAMRISVVNRCVSLIANTVASLPCLLYRQEGERKERAREHRAYRAVRRKPNAWQTRSQFFRDMQANVSLHGKAFAQAQDDGRTIAMVPRKPQLVELEQFGDGPLRFQYRNPKTHQKETILQDEMLYIRDIAPDFHTGLARAALAREAIAVASAAEQFVRRFFVNDAGGRLAFKYPGNLSPEKKAEIEEYLYSKVMGVQNARRPFLAWGGAEIQELTGMTEEQFLVDPRKFQAADIARFWGVPGFLIGLEEKSTSWGTGIAEQKQGFVDFTIKPEALAWEESLAQTLLTDEEQDDHFFEFEFGALLQANPKDQAETFGVYIENGVMNRNEVRTRLNMNPRDGGDAFQENTPGAAPNALGARAPAEDPEPDEEADARHQVPAPLVADAATRIAAAMARGGKAKWAEYVTRTLAPLVAAYELPAWVVETAAEQISTAEVGKDATARRTLVLEILQDTLTAGAALAQAEAA